MQFWHKDQGYSSVLRQTAGVGFHCQSHQQFFELILDSSSLANPYLQFRQYYPYYEGEMLTILTFQSHKCLRRIFGIHDFRKINPLKSMFSIVPGLFPLIFNVWISQVDIFIDYLTIKFGEYNHQRNCKIDQYNMLFCFIDFVWGRWRPVLEMNIYLSLSLC